MPRILVMLLFLFYFLKLWKNPALKNWPGISLKIIETLIIGKLSTDFEIFPKLGLAKIRIHDQD